MAWRVVHSFFADGRLYAAAGGTALHQDGRQQAAPPHSRCAIYNGRRVRSLLAPIHGYMPFIHEWHGASGSEYTRMARFRCDGARTVYAQRREKGPLPWGSGPEQMDMAERGNRRI